MTFDKLKLTQFKITLIVSAIAISGISLVSTQIPQAEAGSGSSGPLLGEIMWSGFNFPPRGYAQCDGQILPINQNQALFSLFGTTYGGDGQTTFALPDLRGRAMMHEGTGPGLSRDPRRGWRS